MKHYSLNFVVSGDEATERAIGNVLGAMEMVLNSNGIAAELIMFTEVDQEWVDNIHASLDKADEE